MKDANFTSSIFTGTDDVFLDLLLSLFNNLFDTTRMYSAVF